MELKSTARPVMFETHPDRYNHWKLSFDGPIATLALDEIRRLLADRDALYARAPLAVQTSGKTAKQSLNEIRKALL